MKQIKYTINSVVGAVSAALLVGTTRLVSASDISDGTDIGKTGGVGDKQINQIVPNLVNVLMWVVGIISVIIIIMAGITYATASGDESKTKKARMAIIGGLIGLAVAVLAYTITYFVANQFKTA